MMAERKRGRSVPFGPFHCLFHSIRVCSPFIPVVELSLLEIVNCLAHLVGNFHFHEMSFQQPLGDWSIHWFSREFVELNGLSDLF